jgi:hypothetical protein
VQSRRLGEDERISASCCTPNQLGFRLSEKICDRTLQIKGAIVKACPFLRADYANIRNDRANRTGASAKPLAEAPTSR